MGCNLCFNKERDNQEQILKEDNDMKKLNQQNQIGRLRAARRKVGEDEDEEIEEEPIKIPEKLKSTTSLSERVECISCLNTNLIAVGLSSGYITIYSISDDSLKEEASITTNMGHNGSVQCIIPIRGGKFASGGGDAIIKVWNDNSFMLLQNIKLHDDWVNCLLQPKDRDILISGSSDQSIKVIDLSSNNQCKFTFNVEDNVTCLADLNDGKFASNANDAVVIWDLNSQSELMRFEGNSSVISDIIFISDINVLISGSENGVIKGYDMDKKKNAFNIRNQGNGNLHALEAFGGSIIAASYGNIIKMWNIDNKMEVKSFTGHSGDVKAIMKMDDFIISGGYDKTLKVWG